MICKIIPRRVLTYSFVVFLLSCAFCAFGSSSSASAISHTCTLVVDFANNSNQRSLINLTSCSDFDNTQVNYVRFDSVIPSTSWSNIPWCISSYYMSRCQDRTVSLNFDKTSTILPTTFSYSNGSYSYTPYFYLHVYQGYTAPTTTSITIGMTFSTDISDFASASEPCPVCPVVPDNPYDNKLDNITKAIYVCGASLLVIYFFFCIYKIVVKDGGSR